MSKKFRRILAGAARVALLAYLGVTGFVWWQQDALIFKPSVAAYGKLPASHGLTHEETDIEVAPGVKIRGWFVQAVGEAQGTILYFHGNAGNLSTNLAYIQQFASEGFHSFSIDYEGYGESGGKPSESNLYRDAEAAWTWLTKTKGTDPKSILVWGHSLGGGVATWCASRHSPRLVVLDSTFTSMPDMGALIYPWLPVKLISRSIFANLERVQSIRSPILVASSKSDELVPFEMGQRLFQAANSPKRFVELKGDHSDGFTSSPQAWAELKEFFAAADQSVSADSKP